MHLAVFVTAMLGLAMQDINAVENMLLLSHLFDNGFLIIGITLVKTKLIAWLFLVIFFNSLIWQLGIDGIVNV